jgi:hypothetical protein
MGKSLLDWLVPVGENRLAVMLVTFKREGGLAFFPRLNRPVVIDTAELPQQQRDELEDCLRKSDFFALPPNVGQKAPGAADMREYIVTVEHASQKHTVRFIEPFDKPEVETLIARLEAQARS